MLSVSYVLILMGVVFMILGGVSRTLGGKAGIISNSPVESVAIGIAIIGILLFFLGIMLTAGSESQKATVAKWALPASMLLSIVLAIMSGLAVAGKDVKFSEQESADQKAAKKHLTMMFGVILALSIVNVLVIGGGMMYKGGSIEGGISSRFGFDFEF